MQKEITISIRPKLLEELDYIRHDVKRSTYISKIIEQHLNLMNMD